MKRSTILITSGIAFILAAAGICGYNFLQNQHAEAFAQETLTALQREIPKTPAITTVPQMSPEDDLFAQYTELETPEEMPQIVIDGTAYCGSLSLPSLNLELPVVYTLTDDAMKLAPCRYSGSPLADDFIIAAHNYKSQFGRIRHLADGDPIVFTDCTGNIIRYEVTECELISGNDAQTMNAGKSSVWALTLFTCDLSGQNRITVRASRILE